MVLKVFEIKEKYKVVFKKNKSFHIMVKIPGEISTFVGLPEDLINHDLLHYKYTPITYVGH